MKSIVLCGGGTAGHIVPNIALIPELKKYFSEIVYLGGANSMEERLAKEVGLKFISVPSVKFNREKLWENIDLPFKLNTCIKKCKKIMKEISPDVVFSKGGYVSLPVVLSAKKLKIPYCIHESDSTLGLANKLCAKNAETVFTNFENTYDGKNGATVGIPLQKSLFETKSRRDILNNLNLPDRATVLITGGSLGSKNLNEKTRAILPILTKEFNVVHLTGKNNLSNDSYYGYCQIEYTNEIGNLYKISDIVICRAGATTLCELNALSKKAVLVPLSKKVSRGDQIKNAKEFIKNGNCVVLDDDTLSANQIYDAVKRLIMLPNPIKKSVLNPSMLIAEKLYDISLK